VALFIRRGKEDIIPGCFQKRKKKRKTSSRLERGRSQTTSTGGGEGKKKKEESVYENKEGERTHWDCRRNARRIKEGAQKKIPQWRKGKKVCRSPERKWRGPDGACTEKNRKLQLGKGKGRGGHLVDSMRGEKRNTTDFSAREGLQGKKKKTCLIKKRKRPLKSR